MDQCSSSSMVSGAGVGLLQKQSCSRVVCGLLCRVTGSCQFKAGLTGGRSNLAMLQPAPAEAFDY